MTEYKKYWCPSHPEVQSNDPNAICTQCGTMRLIPRESNEHPPMKKTTSLKDLLPLLSIFAVVIGLTLIFNYLVFDPSPALGMRLFMGIFFVVFGGFKIINLKGFADAYQDYDLIAQKSRTYAFLYPFLELALGISYLVGMLMLVTNVITFVIMSIGALGVYIKLRKGEEIVCACLGVVFKVPMTWVTLLEDVVMAVMALVMIIFF